MKDKYLKHLEDEHKAAIARWEGRGMLEGLSGEQKVAAAILMDNTAREQGYTEANINADVVGANKLPQVIGMVRRVFPRLFANELFSVQPLQLPTGKIFFLDVKRLNNNVAEGYVNSYDSTKRSWANDPGEGGTIVKEMQLELSSADVSATSRKLKSTYTVELEQDLRAYHGLAAGDLLDAAADEELIREIDDTLIYLARDNATKRVTYTAKPTGYTIEEWDKRLFYAIQVANNEIFKARYVRGNWLLCDPEFLNRLFRVDHGIALETGGDDEFQVGINRIGTMTGLYRLYCSATYPTKEALLGRSGTQLFDAGLVYAPYVPFYSTPVFQDPETLKFKRGFMTRSANYVVSGDHYVRLVMDDAVTTDIAVDNNPLP